MKQIELKAGVYANDVLTICGADSESIQGIFRQYERLTKKSGMELNAEKTERLSLHSDRQIAFNVEYCGMNIQLKT